MHRMETGKIFSTGVQDQWLTLPEAPISGIKKYEHNNPYLQITQVTHSKLPLHSSLFHQITEK